MTTVLTTVYYVQTIKHILMSSGLCVCLQDSNYDENTLIVNDILQQMTSLIQNDQEIRQI